MDMPSAMPTCAPGDSVRVEVLAGSVVFRVVIDTGNANESAMIKDKLISELDEGRADTFSQKSRSMPTANALGLEGRPTVVSTPTLRRRLPSAFSFQKKMAHARTTSTRASLLSRCTWFLLRPFNHERTSSSGGTGPTRSRRVTHGRLTNGHD